MRAQNSQIIMRLPVRGFADWGIFVINFAVPWCLTAQGGKFRFTGANWLSWGICCVFVIQVLLAYRFYGGRPYSQPALIPFKRRDNLFSDLF